MKTLYFIQVPAYQTQITSTITEAANWGKTASIYIMAILMATAVIAFVIHRD